MGRLLYRAGALLGLLLAGCGVQDPYERVARPRTSEGETLMPRDEQSLRAVVMDSANGDEVLAMVKSYPSPEPQIDTETWLTKQLQDDPGQVMFPRWEVQKRGANKYEARFTYTHIGTDNRMVKKGLSWNVDAVLKVVSPPRELPPEDRVGRGMRTETEAGEKRIRKAEAALE